MNFFNSSGKKFFLKICGDFSVKIKKLCKNFRKKYEIILSLKKKKNL